MSFGNYDAYDQQRVKQLRAIGVHKPYDIIQKFLEVKKIGKYKPTYPVAGVKMEIGDEIDELEAIIILDAAAYWVSIYHKISDHPINVRTGVPLKEWWIQIKVDSFAKQDINLMKVDSIDMILTIWTIIGIKGGGILIETIFNILIITLW